MGKIITRLYAYDSSQEENNYRGEDFSSFILQGDSDSDDLTEILDVVELTLTGLTFSEEFEPDRKFIFEKWEKTEDAEGETERMWKDWHLCVATDIVTQPILSNDKYFDHHVTFNEASVDSQGRLVDNIAVTYRLKDVSIESKPTYDVNAKAITRFSNVVWTPSENFGAGGSGLWDQWIRIGKQFIWVFPNWDGQQSNITEWTDFLLNQEVDPTTNVKTVSLPVPMLEIKSGDRNSKNFSHQGYCSVDVIVEETVIATNEKKIIKKVQVNPSSASPTENVWVKNWEMGNLEQKKGEATSRVVFASGWKPLFQGPSVYNYSKQVAQFDSEIQNRRIEFEIHAGCKYSVSISLHNFTINGNESYDTSNRYDSSNPIAYKYDGSVGGEPLTGIYVGKNNVNYTNQDYPCANIQFNAVLKGEDKSLYLRNAPTENAYNLYNKAFLTTQNHFKIKGVPIDETPKAYYLEDADKQELQNTIIVENFYNQKNWWELQLDIGKYIHAIPKVRFGKDDRFVTTWKKLGDPTQYLDVGNKITIYNSKNIEEYVDACSSYVSNMVQLGGVIDEWVAPKSSSSDYLVYNDVAEIITSMNIIELVDLEVKNVSCPFIESNDIRNLVGKGTRGEDPNGFIFEENIYNILSINANDSVNKGFALYYSLGTNKIQGLSYQLPSVNTGDNVQEYAVKRILGKVFSVDPAKWKDLKINDFIFHVVYRTKDSIRTNQTRPDLRKYLLASKYDRVPQHNQFNNQTDTVVDSVKFGNNTYGLLIRTGNTTYKVTEWVTSLFKLKQSGELYKIRDNLYYVSKVKNTYYSNHIISEVEFSKDFNRLSQIIGIPSEPRFYEISEQSQIKRDISLDEYIVVGTKPIEVDKTNSFIRQSGWEFISNLLLGNINHYPKYAVTKFKNDIDKSTIAGNETYNVEVCTALSSLSIQNTLTFSWKMKDNFSAGDQVVGTSLSVKDDDKTNTAYAQLKPFRYPDVYGRADLLDFSIIEDYEMTPEQVHNRPLNPIDTITNKLCLFSSEKEGEIIVPNSHGIALLKDNREMLSFNFNLQVISDSDRFVLSAYMWQNNKNNLKLALLNEEVNKISNETIPNRIITEQLFDIDKELLPNCAGIKINIEKTLKNVNLENISSIAIISTNEVNDYVNSGAKYFVIARNVSDLSIEEKKQDWYLGNVDTSYFKVK